jgi:hypothetical protein
LISGTDADGAAYALVDRSTLDRTGAVLNSQDETETRLALAKDLGVALNRLLVLDMGGHLDTQIKALPGGVVLIQDPTRIVETMELLSARSESGSLEQRTYERVARIYRDGHQRYDHAGRPIGTPSRPWGSSSEAQLAAAIALLQSDPALRVVPVMGQFGDLSDERRSWIWDWRNNFFNAMTGLTPDGRVFWVGNRTRMASKPAGRLPQLEAYWSEVLRQHGVDPDLIRFWGRFDGAGGVNCTGFPKP